MDDFIKQFTSKLLFLLSCIAKKYAKKQTLTFPLVCSALDFVYLFIREGLYKQ